MALKLYLAMPFLQKGCNLLLRVSHLHTVFNYANCFIFISFSAAGFSSGNYLQDDPDEQFAYGFDQLDDVCN